MDFGRLITAMVTPFDNDRNIDWDRAGKLIDYLIEEQASDGIVVCGTTGESPTLSDEEKLALIEFAVRQANGRCKVIAGTGSNNTEHSIHLSRQAERLGADGLLVVAPYYNRPTQAGMYEHFKAIALATKLPVVLYNIPKRTGVNIDADTTIKLANEIANIAAIKESNDLEQAAKIAANVPEHFKIYSGDDSNALPLLSVGGYGVVSVASHVIGRPIKQMIEAFVSGNVREAARLHQRHLPIFQGLFVAPNPVPVKYALELRGMPAGGVRLPLVEATDGEKALIRSLFE